jgi:hypothetical protein
MLPRDYVFDVEGKNVVVILVKPAVFAATACPLADESTKRSVHQRPEELARSWRALDFRMAMNVLNET